MVTILLSQAGNFANDSTDLYFLQTKPQFTSIDEVIAHIDKKNANPHIHQNDLRKFQKFVNQTNEMMLSTSDENGQPSSRKMRFIVLDDAPNIWYFGTAPDTPRLKNSIVVWRQFTQCQLAKE